MKILATPCFVIVCFLCLSQAPQPLPYCEGTQKYQAFYDYDSNNHSFGVKTFMGDTLLTGINRYFRFESTFQDSCHVQLSRVILWEENKSYCVDLISNKRSDEYREMYFYDGLLIAIDSSGWTLLNSDMKPIGLKCRGIPEFFSLGDYMFTKEDPIFFEEGYVLNNHLNVKFNKHILSYLTFNENTDKYKYGLVDVKKEIMINDDYDGIIGLISDKEIYYWGFNKLNSFYDTKSSREKSSGVIDIYTSNLKKIASYNFGESIEFISDKTNYQAYFKSWLDQLVIFPSSDGKYGAVDSKGEPVIPFINDSIKPYVSSYEASPHYRVWNNGKVRLLNGQGKRTIKGEFVEILGNSDTSKFIVRTDTTKNSYNLVDVNSKVLIENCSQIFFINSLDVSSFTPKTQLTSFKLPFYQVIKDNTYYVFSEEKLLRYDSINFEFVHPISLLFSHYIVNTEGKILYSGNNIYLRHKRYLGGYDQSSGMPFIISLDGTKHMKFSSCKNIDFGGAFVKVEFNNGEIKKFYLDKWDWE